MLETSGLTTKRTRNNVRSHLTTPFSSPPAITLTDIPSGWLEKATEQMISLQWTWPIRSPFTVHRRRSLPPPTEINMSELSLTGWTKALYMLYAVLNHSERVRREDRSNSVHLSRRLLRCHRWSRWQTQLLLDFCVPWGSERNTTCRECAAAKLSASSHRERSYFFLCHIPVEVPEDTGAIFAHADEDTVGFAHKQAGDLSRVSVQVNLRLHLHLWWLRVFRQNTCEGDVCWWTLIPLIPFVCSLETCFEGNCDVTNDAESFSTIRAGVGWDVGAEAEGYKGTLLW